MAEPLPEPGRSFTCETCDEHPVFKAVEDVKTHLSQVHFKCAGAPKQGMKKMLLHVDHAKYASTVYEWKIGHVKIIENAVSPRNRNDKCWSKTDASST